MTLLLHCFANLYLLKVTNSNLGSLVPGNVQRPIKEWFHLRSLNLKEANGRILEERKIERQYGLFLFMLGN